MNKKELENVFEQNIEINNNGNKNFKEDILNTFLSLYEEFGNKKENSILDILKIKVKKLNLNVKKLQVEKEKYIKNTKSRKEKLIKLANENNETKNKLINYIENKR